ncbi:UDP-N-acetylmuramate dehydrogenase [soil metagenome]
MPTPSSLSPTIKEHVPLAPYTTLRIGGPARFFCDISSEAALLEAVQFARERSLRVFVLGGGSNLLVGDKGFDGLVLHLTLNAPVQTTSTAEHMDCIAPAGLDWDAFVLQICQQGISGVECLAGIPGLVGGTPVQNVGAYGQEVADTIHSVRALDLETLTFVDLPRGACAFGYRRSIFNSTYPNRYIVTAVEFRFSTSATPNITYADLKSHFASTPTPPTPLDVYHAVREIRSRKGMLLVEGEPDCRSAGSFFKNPIVPATILNYIADSLNLDPAAVPNWPTPDGKLKLPAAWLLERAGFHRGFALGEAGISSRHTLALINRGHATATDITALRDRIQQEIKAKFGIQLEQEPVELKS